METPNKMMGGIAGAVGQVTSQQTTGLPMQQPVFPPAAQQAGQAMFGTQQPGSYDRVMPQAGVTGSAFQSKKHPGKDGHTGHLKDPVSGENKKVFDDSKKKKPMPIDEGTKKQQENKKVANLLNARSSKDLKKENKKKIDPVTGKTMFISPPKRTYSESSSKIIYNEDGSVSAKQTIK